MVSLHTTKIPMNHYGKCTQIQTKEENRERPAEKQGADAINRRPSAAAAIDIHTGRRRK